MCHLALGRVSFGTWTCVICHQNDTCVGRRGLPGSSRGGPAASGVARRRSSIPDFSAKREFSFRTLPRVKLDPTGRPASSRIMPLPTDRAHASESEGESKGVDYSLNTGSDDLRREVRSFPIGCVEFGQLCVEFATRRPGRSVRDEFVS